MKTRQDQATQDFMNRMVADSPSLQMLFADFEQKMRESDARNAKADPKRYRRTRVFDEGVHTGYRYFPVREKGRPEVRFCWAVNRNAAGFFLVWRETVTRRQVRRDEFDGIGDKRAAISHARLCRDAERMRRAKPKQEGAHA
jgi:hypothetical protein